MVWQIRSHHRLVCARLSYKNMVENEDEDDGQIR